MTQRLIAAIAEDLRRPYGGSEQFNWPEVERHLERIVSQVRAEAKKAEVIHALPWFGMARGMSSPSNSMADRRRNYRMNAEPRRDRVAKSASYKRQRAGRPGGVRLLGA
jgi:hypothetical protein